MVLFSPNTPSDLKRSLSDLLSRKIVDKLDKYLGLPLPIGKKRRDAFTDIINKLSYRINSWTKRLLSYGGKEVMIKAVLQSIPTYALSIFLASKERLINNKESLCFKVLSSKYFPDGNIFNAKRVNRASFTWTSIATAAEFLKNGSGWQIGNGENINIWADNWGFEGLNGSTMIPNMLSPSDENVRNLWMENVRRWNVDKVHRLYGKEWGDRICSIPIGDESQKDRMVWLHNPHGFFTSKSAYSWLLLKDMGYGPHRLYWKTIWKLDTLLKIRVFA
ncbi:hypothetical protein J1N35_002124 [Gossypium stocksii]|uniref:Reverse transcriptase n=1 Tax=Gossypium stocksii TaxID=47602 RepID=A0A9D3WLW7_9ROSI|nr:hypothetical protein J1N35_002124 [Gossypium stocksii]